MRLCLDADAFVRAFGVLILFDVSRETESISRSWKNISSRIKL